MKMISSALRNPIVIIVIVLAIGLFSFLAIRNTKIDIFPNMGVPTIYVAQPYGGLSPQQMEGFVSSYYEYHFLYISGVKSVDSRSIQGNCLIKITFQEGTDMSQAMAEVVGYVNRARAFMPPGTVPPFITRFDAGSVPVGQLVFTSDTRSLGEISDLALFRVRPMFATLPGVSAPPPFGGNQKTVIVDVNPDQIRKYNLSPDKVVQALVNTDKIVPTGNVRIGDSTYIVPQNSVVENIQNIANTPLVLGSGPTIYIKDLATVSMGADITSSYALVNGKRSVFIPVTKRSTASTWDVVKEVKASLPDFQASIPSDIKVSYQFDQSGYVINSLKSLLFEGGLGALLTGLMVLLFLGDLRSALIVIFTIPLALLAASTVLYLAGQTLNIMTLGGLALSVGILVDQATVTIENIHRHQETGKPKSLAIIDACKEISWPELLILLSILSVFVPSFFMQGVTKSMFLPLSLAVGCAMIASFFLSQTFVPVVSNWMLKSKLHREKISAFDRFREKYLRNGTRLSGGMKWISGLFIVASLVLLFFLFGAIGTELFPQVDTGQTQIRLRMPVGTRLERTEEGTRKLLAITDTIAGKQNVEITSAFLGTQPSSYPIDLIFIWTGGYNESVIKIKLKPGAIPMNEFKERMREKVKQTLPGATISFEPGDLVEQVLGLGTSNPVEIAVLNRNLQQGETVANTLVKKLSSIKSLRDLQIATPLHYPAVQIDIDRVKAGQLNLTASQIAQSTIAATSSSRFTAPVYWLDKNTGTAYQVQVQYPQYKMNSPSMIEQVPVNNNQSDPVYLGQVASWQKTTVPGEYDRLNQQRYITITANIQGEDMGGVFKNVKNVISEMKDLPGNTKILLRGQPELLSGTMNNLQTGLLIAIVVILLIITVYFRSFRVALATLSIIPAVLSGSLLLLLITGKTLNIQSYMGMIMAVGVAIANAVLFLTIAEINRKKSEVNGHLQAAASRLRPILMTSIAMIAGMIPMAIGIGESGDQTSPLGIAVIGGLLFSLVSVLFFLPFIYYLLEGRRKYQSPSLDPYDPESSFYLSTHKNEK
jgi:multidrug efflux pump subunit AcrB